MKKNQGGFTLVEIMVTIVVAAVVIGSLSQVVTSFVHVSQRGRYLNLANSFIEGQVESLRNTGYNSLNTGTTSLTASLPSQLPPGSTSSMTVTSPSLGIKQVDLTVTYKDQAQNYSYGYTTYVGELGVGQ